MRRRDVNAALTAAALAGPLSAWGTSLPSDLSAAMPSLQRWGTGEFRRFGFFVYEATLWAGERQPLRPPLALSLTYKRRIEGKAIAEASVDQMRRFGAQDADLVRWQTLMAALFPDVKDGDQIVGLQLPDRARFYFNGQTLGDIAGADFAQTFFAIWLDPRTSEPRLRAELLKPAA